MATEGRVEIADVSVITPALRVRLKGATVDTPADLKSSTTATLAVNDRVALFIDPNTREVVVMAKLVTA